MQLAHAGFLEFIASTMDRHGIRAEQINLEVIESLLMDADGVIPIMQRLADMGIKLSNDDFGTGYSSLSYLQLEMLRELQCDEGQGYHFSKPLSAEMIGPLLAVWSKAPGTGATNACSAREVAGRPITSAPRRSLPGKRPQDAPLFQAALSDVD